MGQGTQAHINFEPKGEGVSFKPKFFKEEHGVEFPEGWGEGVGCGQTKKADLTTSKEQN